MKFFNEKEKDIKFTEARCPRCGGRLEVDSAFNVAYCKDCGCSCIISNYKVRPMGRFDKLIALFDRQQEMYRQDKKDQKEEDKLVQIEEERKEKELAIKKEKLKLEKREKRHTWWAKNWWIVFVIIIAFILLGVLLDYLGIINIHLEA